MAPFTFQSVQSWRLTLDQDDKPTVRIQGGELVLTAERDGEHITITAPYTSSSAPIVPTPVKTVVRVDGRRNNGGNLGKGVSHVLAKLTEENVREIRALANDPSFRASYPTKMRMLMELAKTYGVHHTTIVQVINRFTWKHVK